MSNLSILTMFMIGKKQKYFTIILYLVTVYTGVALFFLGKVLNVESQEMKFHEWGVGVDPDESCWVESVKYNISFLVVIRVFYEVGPPAYEEIGI